VLAALPPVHRVRLPDRSNEGYARSCGLVGASSGTRDADRAAVRRWRWCVQVDGVTTTRPVPVRPPEVGAAHPVARRSVGCRLPRVLTDTSQSGPGGLEWGTVGVQDTPTAEADLHVVVGVVSGEPVQRAER